MIGGVPEQFVAVAPLGLMVLYFAGVSLSIANYAGYFRFNEEIYGTAFLRAYLIFTVLGNVGYYLGAGPAWLWAAKYSDTMKQRFTRTAVGMGIIFFTHDLPLLIMEWHAILCCGWRNDFSSFVFIMQWIQFIISFCFGWLGYTYLISGLLENSFGDSSLRAAGGGGLKTGAEQIAILPPLSSASTPMLVRSESRHQPQPVPFEAPLSGGPFSPREMRQFDDRGGDDEGDEETPMTFGGGSRAMWSQRSHGSSGARDPRTWGSRGSPPTNSTSTMRPVPLQEGLARANAAGGGSHADLGSSYGEDSMDGDDAHYGGGGGGSAGKHYASGSARGLSLGSTFGSTRTTAAAGAAGAAAPSAVYKHERPYHHHDDPTDVSRVAQPSHSPRRGGPMTASLPPLHVGSPAGYGDTPPTVPQSDVPRRPGTVYVEHTLI